MSLTFSYYLTFLLKKYIYFFTIFSINQPSSSFLIVNNIFQKKKGNVMRLIVFDRTKCILIRWRVKNGFSSGIT